MLALGLITGQLLLCVTGNFPLNADAGKAWDKVEWNRKDQFQKAFSFCLPHCYPLPGAYLCAEGLLVP